jgi:predicted alpha/beta superfamily hydrolase
VRVKIRRAIIRHLTVVLAPIVVLFVSGTARPQQPHTLTGNIVHQSFHSKLLNNDRDLVVFLPPGYEKNRRAHYAVFYLQDGQNLFDGATSFIPGQEWQVDETAQALISAGKIEPLIIVGVYNTGKERINEYTPAADSKIKMGGQADRYGQMLIEELKPFIDLTYRTRKDARHTGLGGSSLGGLVSLYLGLKYASVFGRVAVVSPSVWFADKHIVKYVEALPKKPNLRIWLDTGTKEGRDVQEAQQTVNDARLLKDKLLSKGWQLGKDLSYFEAEGAEHNERSWAARMERILEFLFPRRE